MTPVTCACSASHKPLEILIRDNKIALNKMKGIEGERSAMLQWKETIIAHGQNATGDRGCLSSLHLYMHEGQSATSSAFIP